MYDTPSLAHGLSQMHHTFIYNYYTCFFPVLQAISAGYENMKRQMPWLCSHGICLCFVDHRKGQAVQDVMLLIYPGIDLRERQTLRFEFKDAALRHV